MRALVKLEQVLPSHLRRRVNALQTATVTLATSGGPTVDPEALTAIAGACRDRERLRFAYRGRDAAETRRRVEPHTLVNLGRRWYLVAWDCDREDWRTFRVDRLDAPLPGRRALRAARAAQRRRRRPSWRRTCRARRRATRPASPCTPGRRGGRARALRRRDRRGDRRAHVRAAHERRLAGLAGRARGHARRRLRGPRAARARRARARAGGALRSGRRAPRDARDASIRAAVGGGRAPVARASRSASVYSFAAAAPAPGRAQCSPPEHRATVVWLRVGEPTGALPFLAGGARGAREPLVSICRGSQRHSNWS